MRLRHRFKLLSLAAAVTLVGCQDSGGGSANTSPVGATQASFEWFEYQGDDAIFSEPLAAGEYQNPIIAGFYPDPSIVRVGDDFYMVHSSFSWVPGIPIFHSRDLIHWDKLGHVLTRPEQLPLEGRQVSEGMFAPTIRHHDGVFYMITTAVYSGGNFLVTATDPAGPWSDPIWLPEVGGIDPDIFFDDDGRIYIAHNDGPEGESLYEGHRALWLWEYDADAQAVIPPGRMIVDGGVDITQEPVWIEAPHIFKHEGWYYLTAAEGGTGPEHSQVIFRTRHLDEPFVPYEQNPILTQRDLPVARDNPITSAGHADFVQLSNGDWWAVFLATRAYDERYHNTGRETFLLPVTWQNGWPHILPAQTEIPYRLPKPNLPDWEQSVAPTTGNFTWRDDFEEAQLAPQWSMLRGNDGDWYRVTEGRLTLTPQATRLAERSQPSLIARRQAHMTFEASTELQLPLAEGFSAGLVAIQNETHYYYLGVERNDEGHRLFVESANGDAAERIHTAQVPNTESIVLSAQGDQGEISFYYQLRDAGRQPLLEGADAKRLSTAVAGGFVGAHIGMHARLEERPE